MEKDRNTWLKKKQNRKKDWAKKISEGRNESCKMEKKKGFKLF